MSSPLVDVLRSSPVFASFTPADCDFLAQAMTVKSYAAGHALVRQGDRGDTFYVILDGEVRVTRDGPDGRRVEVETLRRGEVFGLLSLIDHGPRAATCTAAGPVTVASLPAVAFTLLYKGNAALGFRFRFMIARQLARDARALNQLLAAALQGGPDTSATQTLTLSPDYHLTTGG